MQNLTVKRFSVTLQPVVVALDDTVQLFFLYTLLS